MSKKVEMSFGGDFEKQMSASQSNPVTTVVITNNQPKKSRKLKKKVKEGSKSEKRLLPTKPNKRDAAAKLENRLKKNRAARAKSAISRKRTQAQLEGLDLLKKRFLSKIQTVNKMHRPVVFKQILTVLQLNGVNMKEATLKNYFSRAKQHPLSRDLVTIIEDLLDSEKKLCLPKPKTVLSLESSDCSISVDNCDEQNCSRLLNSAHPPKKTRSDTALLVIAVKRLIESELANGEEMSVLKAMQERILAKEDYSAQSDIRSLMKLKPEESLSKDDEPEKKDGLVNIDLGDSDSSMENERAPAPKKTDGLVNRGLGDSDSSMENERAPAPKNTDGLVNGGLGDSDNEGAADASLSLERN